MDAKHTTGTLIVAASSSGSNRMIISTDRIPCIAETYNEGAEENARRMVACWNACDGLSPGLLESIGVMGDTLASRFKLRDQNERDLTTQRDALLEALIEISGMSVGTTIGRTADAAIAKATGVQG